MVLVLQSATSNCNLPLCSLCFMAAIILVLNKITLIVTGSQIRVLWAITRYFQVQQL
jgi:hypothetical protein